MQTGDRPQQGGLARPVRTDEYYDLAWVDVQADVPQRADIAVVGRHATYLEQRRRRRAHHAAALASACADTLAVTPGRWPPPGPTPWLSRQGDGLRLASTKIGVDHACVLGDLLWRAFTDLF